MFCRQAAIELITMFLCCSAGVSENGNTENNENGHEEEAAERGIVVMRK